MILKNNGIKVVMTLVSLGALALSTQAFANNLNDMPFTCKYEAKRNFGVSQNSVLTLPTERAGNRYVIYAQTPKDTKNALYFKCIFNDRGQYVRIKRSVDKRKANNHIPRSTKRSCKGKAAREWGIRHPHNIKIDKARKMAADDYMINLSGKGYRGKCEVSGNGRIYLFQTTSGNNNNRGHRGQGNNLNNAVKACKDEAQRRWRMTSTDVGADKTKEVAANDNIIYLSARGNHSAQCEANGRGRIYLFSE